MNVSQLTTVAKTLSASLLVLLLLECAVRVAQTFYPTSRPAGILARGAILTPELGWERQPNFDGIVFGERRQYDSNGFLTLDSGKLVDTTRPKVVCIGDSNTFGLGVRADSTFVEVLNRAMPEVDVINLGMFGYTSYQGYKVLEQRGLSLEPSAIIVSLNHNDRRYVLSEDTVDSAERFAAMRRSVKSQRWIDQIYLMRSMRFFLRKMGVVEAVSWQLTVDVMDLEARVPPESYRSNLMKIAALANEHEVPLIFLLLKDSPLFTRDLEEGIQLMAAGDYDAAIQRFFPIIYQRGHFIAIAKRHLVRAYEAKGQEDKARVARLLKEPYKALDGGTPLFRDITYNTIMREVAQESGAILVDAGAALDEDPLVYFDFHHFDVSGHRKVAQLLEGPLRALVAGGGPATIGVADRPVAE